MDPHGHRRRAETRASKAESRLKSSLQERRRRVIAIEMAIEIVDLPKKRRCYIVLLGYHRVSV